MSSVASIEFREGAPISFAAVLSHKLQGQLRSDDTPIVFVVDDEVSENLSLEVLIGKGWHPQTFSSVEECFRHPSALVPSCLILHVSQGGNTLEIQKRLAVERPEMPVILIASFVDIRMAVQAIKAGAIEFLTKPIPDDLLLSAIQQAFDRSRATLARQTQLRALKECYATLTHREREVMALVVSGMLNKEVGAELDITERTVKGHRGRMMEKMKANSLAELVKMAAKLRLPTPKPCTMPSFTPLSSQALA